VPKTKKQTKTDKKPPPLFLFFRKRKRERKSLVDMIWCALGTVDRREMDGWRGKEMRIREEGIMANWMGKERKRKEKKKRSHMS